MASLALADMAWSEKWGRQTRQNNVFCQTILPVQTGKRSLSCFKVTEIIG
jgi:hypothetical protein